jgi:hypothetical protein
MDNQSRKQRTRNTSKATHKKTIMDISMIAYKYLRKEHLKNFIKDGSIRIGTLYEFRDIENQSLRDELEGRRIIKISSGKQPAHFSEKDFQKLLPMIERTEKKNVHIYVDDKTQFEMQVANAYVFCTSLKLDSSLYSRFECDAHYAIHKPIEFAKILFNNLNEVKKFILCYDRREVKYIDKPITLSERNKEQILLDRNETFWDTCFSKPKTFSIEHELRMVFVPESKKDVEPIILKCPELRKCCKF